MQLERSRTPGRRVVAIGPSAGDIVTQSQVIDGWQVPSVAGATSQRMFRGENLLRDCIRKASGRHDAIVECILFEIPQRQQQPAAVSTLGKWLSNLGSGPRVVSLWEILARGFEIVATQRELLEIVRALHAASCFARRLNGWQ